MTDHNARTVLGNVELADFFAFFFHCLAFGRLGGDVGFFGLQVAVIDCDFPFACVGIEFRLGAEDEVGAVSGEMSADEAFGFSAGTWVLGALHALDEFAVWLVDWGPRIAAFKAGRADARSAEGEGLKAGVGFLKGGGKRAAGKWVVGGNTYVLRIPTIFPTRCHVGIN